MSTSTEPNQFLDPDFKAAKYFPIDEDLTEKSQEVRDAWKSIYAFACEVNSHGRQYTPTDIKQQTVLYCQVIHGLNEEKVEGVFKKVFEEHKEEFGIFDKPEIVKAEVFIRKKFELLFNEVTQSIQFRRKGGKWEDLNIDTIFRELQHANFKYGLDKLKSLVRSDFVPRYNPFLEHFNTLPAWDGVTDHIDNLARYVNTTENEFFRTQFKKMLVRCIGCSLYGRENRFVFVFYGEKQSTGKSTFIRFLNPFGYEYYTEAPLRDNRDSEISLSENFTYNLEELTSASNLGVQRLKAIISTVSVKERKAYAANVTQQPRRCNFWGSTNRRDFLTDTENARWLIFELQPAGINWKYKQEIDINLVWAQAFALYQDQTYQDQLTQEEAELRDRNNRAYEVSDLEKELIKKCFKVCQKNKGEFYSNADILQTLQGETTRSLESKYIGKNMSQLGFVPDQKKMHGHNTRGWWVVAVPKEDRAYEDYVVDFTPPF